MPPQPFRLAPIEEACTSCRAPALARCERCGAPLCSEHLAAPNLRCSDCEAGFQARVERPRIVLAPLIAWLLIAPAVSIVTEIGAPFLFCGALKLLLGTLFIAPFVTIGYKACFRAIQRLRFLKERSVIARLPVHYSEDSWFELGDSWARGQARRSALSFPPGTACGRH